MVRYTFSISVLILFLLDQCCVDACNEYLDYCDEMEEDIGKLFMWCDNVHSILGLLSTQLPTKK